MGEGSGEFVKREGAREKEGAGEGRAIRELTAQFSNALLDILSRYIHISFFFFFATRHYGVGACQYLHEDIVFTTKAKKITRPHCTLFGN